MVFEALQNHSIVGDTVAIVSLNTPGIRILHTNLT